MTCKAISRQIPSVRTLPVVSLQTALQEDEFKWRLGRQKRDGGQETECLFTLRLFNYPSRYLCVTFFGQRDH